ncbi:DedA family protein [Jannaschia sp. M317]|uniref:DedA family protein n=1 Tax=Jannaschia sp. M317 TaxID=2867011 RepID=UPI0021A92DCB|nr:DedA family protein [Jannaschia sp. M317]UWQ19699.1 DedA family protein [Jannaschia sp. M317]
METLLNWIAVNPVAVYALLFGYCALKSGALPLLAGVVAQQGVLDPILVAVTVFLGGYLGDEARFAVARRYGGRLFAARPKIRAWIEQAGRFLDTYGITYIFIYRYPKGLRTIGALPVGLSGMSWRTFTVFNAASAIVWAGVLVGIGYLLGEQIAAAAESRWGFITFLLLVFFLGASWLAFRSFTRSLLDAAGK